MESKHSTADSSDIENDINTKNLSFNMELIIQTLIDMTNSIDKAILLNININKLNKYCLKDELLSLTSNCNNSNSATDLTNNKGKDIIIMKYLCIIIIPITFYQMDEVIIRFNNQKLKDYLIQVINYILKNSSNKQIYQAKFKNFQKRYMCKPENIMKITKSIIKQIFSNKLEYSGIKKATDQIVENCQNLSLKEIQNKINNIILYANDMKSQVKVKVNIDKKSKDPNALSLIAASPFIKEKLTKKFCLVLDMDETLEHSMTLNTGTYFMLRPYVHDFLISVSPFYEIIIFTNSPESYADSILNRIDIEDNLINYRLYRKHTGFLDGKSVKDLSLIGRDLSKIVLIDNIKDNAKYQKDNLLPIKGWYNDIFDQELLLLKQKLINIANNPKFDNDIRLGLK